VIVAHVLGFAASAATGALLFLPGASEGRGLWLPGMFAAFTVFGVINAQDLPTRNAMIRDIVPEAMVMRAVTIFQLALSATMLTAGPIAGLAIDHLGFGVTYLIASLGHLVVLAAAWPMRVSATAADPEASDESMLDNVRAGIDYLRSDAVVRWVVFATWLGFAAGISVMGLLIAAWASDVLRLDATGWGLMMMTWGGGGVLSSSLLAMRSDLRRRGALFLGAMLFFGLSVIAFGLSHNVALAFLFNGTAGAAFMVVRVLGIAIVQGRVPNRLLGRVMGLVLLAQGIAQAVGLAVGGLGQTIGLELLYPIAGVSIVLLALAVAGAQRPLRSAH
jgi:DHA3 family macrolide efflux protein-like MFS transporter